MEFLTGVLFGALANVYVFFALCVVCFFTIAVSIDDSRNGEGWGWATIGAGGLMYLGFNYTGATIASITSAIPTMLIATGLYFLVGVLWSFAKWYFKLINIRDQYVAVKERFIEQFKCELPFPTPVIAMSDEELENLSKAERAQYEEQFDKKRDICSSFVGRVENLMRVYKHKDRREVLANPNVEIMQMIKPVANLHKSTITQWIAFWPISFVWTMINDPVRKLVNYIFSRIKSIYQHMADSAFSGV